MDEYKLIVTATMQGDNGLRQPAITSQVLSYDAIEDADAAYNALKAQGAKSAVYLNVWRCYAEE